MFWIGGIYFQLGSRSLALGGKGKMDIMKNKRGVIDQLAPVVIAIVALAITLIVGFLILAQLAANTTVAAEGNATAAVNTVTSAMDDIPGWLPIIVITIIGALLIGLVAMFRGRR